MKQQLLNIAKIVRAKLSKEYDLEGEPPKALCLEFSKELAKTLIQQGFKAKVIKGKFSIDNPNPEDYQDWEVNEFEDVEDMESAMLTPLHYWVQVENFVVDITADQFNEENSEESNHVDPVTVDTYDNLYLWIKN